MHDNWKSHCHYGLDFRGKVRASNGEIIAFNDEIKSIQERCRNKEASGDSKTSHDLVLDLYLSGNPRGLHYLAILILPHDFENYTNQKKIEYKNYIGELLIDEVGKCDKDAITIYGKGLGEGVNWEVKNNGSNKDLINYQKKLVLDIYKRTGGSNEPIDAELLELSSRLKPEDREIARKNTEQMLNSCIKKGMDK